MQKARQLSLFIAISVWAIMIGGILYSHIVFFPPYLSNLPESNQLITGKFGLHDQNFWLLFHPLALIFTVTTLVLNWRLKPRRKFILITLGIYVLAIVVTATYFVPGLIAFSKSGTTPLVTPAAWLERGQTWELMSWIRGFFMVFAFVMLLIALTKDKKESVMLKFHS